MEEGQRQNQSDLDYVKMYPNIFNPDKLLAISIRKTMFKVTNIVGSLIYENGLVKYVFICSTSPGYIYPLIRKFSKNSGVYTLY